MGKSLDFLAVGEALIDLISKDLNTELSQAGSFHPFPGGQSSNLAVTISRLGLRTGAAVSIGEDGFGRLLLSEYEKSGVDTSPVQVDHTSPTSIVVVSRHKTTPEFIAYRGADTRLNWTPVLEQAVKNSRVVHTSAFALAQDPARTTILQALDLARTHQALITIDPNFHPGVYPDREDFLEMFKETLSYADIIKPSFDDSVRIFGPGLELEDYIASFLDLGVPTVILTLGKEGALLATQAGLRYRIPTIKVRVRDVTGAGDAFWAGLLYALLDGRDLLDSACFGQTIAAFKIQTVGAIQDITSIPALFIKAETLKKRVLAGMS